MITCSQHRCSDCNRGTADAGGMLFRYVPSFEYDIPLRRLITRTTDVRHAPTRSAKIVYPRATSMPLGIPSPSCTYYSSSLYPTSILTSRSRSLLRGYGETSGAYYIRCHHCQARFETDHVYWKEWQEEFRVNQENLEKMRSGNKL